MDAIAASSKRLVYLFQQSVASTSTCPLPSTYKNEIHFSGLLVNYSDQYLTDEKSCRNKTLRQASGGKDVESLRAVKLHGSGYPFT